jgi:MFS family permease
MTSYAGALRHRDFRLLFLGQSASAVGDQVGFVALALYVTRATGSPTDLGLILAAGSLPMIGLLLIGGVWADRWGGPGRRLIMIAADVVRAVLHGILAASILLGVGGLVAFGLICLALVPRSTPRLGDGRAVGSAEQSPGYVAVEAARKAQIP